MAKKKNTTALDAKVGDIMANIKRVGAELIRDKMLCVNQPEYLAEKQRLLNEIAEEDGTEPRQAKIDDLEYLRIMSEVELQVVLIAMLPIIKIELNPSTEKCKYMIGTLANVLLIKANQIMIRVGGGFATLEDHIRQVGPFECIKIYKLMKGNPDKNEEPQTFKYAVVNYLRHHKCPDRIVKQWLDSENEQQMDLFENAIEYLKEKQDQA